MFPASLINENIMYGVLFMYEQPLKCKNLFFGRRGSKILRIYAGNGVKMGHLCYLLERTNTSYASGPNNYVFCSLCQIFPWLVSSTVSSHA